MVEERYDGRKFYYSVLQCIMTFSFSLFLQMALRFEQQQSCSVPSLSCMDERLLTYSGFVWHIHRKLPGLLEEEREVFSVLTFHSSQDWTGPHPV